MLAAAFGFAAHAVEDAPIQRPEVRLIQFKPNGLPETTASVEPWLDAPQDIELVGQGRTLAIQPSKDRLFQVVWAGVRHPRRKNRLIAFEQPMISLLKSKRSSLRKGSLLPIEGDEAMLRKAIEALQSEEKGVTDAHPKRPAQNPSKKGRFVNLKPCLRNAHRTRAQAHPRAGEQKYAAHAAHRAAQPNAEGRLDEPEQTFGLRQTRSDQSPFSLAERNAHPRGAHGARQGFQAGAYPSVAVDRLGQSAPIAAANPAPSLRDAAPLPVGRSTALPTSPMHPAAHGALGRGHPSVTSVLNRDPRRSGVPQDALGHSPLGLGAPLGDPGNGNGAFNVLGRGYAPAASMVGIELPLPPVGPLPALADQNLEREPALGEPVQPILPQTTYEVTEDGCAPRVDRVHERVIIQNRTQTFEDGRMIEEGPCTDSLEFYPVMKNYLCEGCTDEVHLEARRAYSRYQEYWNDRENIRHPLGEALYTDLTRPYVFEEESGNCQPMVDLEAGLAYKAVETVYHNLHHIRVVVEGCHRSQQVPVPLIQTAAGCELTHDFAANRSYQQERFVYRLDGLEREAAPCRSVEPAYPHAFSEQGCRPITDALTNTLVNTVRRTIQINHQTRFITDECEPHPNQNALQITRDGCEGEYYHDFHALRSYLKKRYFYRRVAGREYVTPCLRTGEFIDQDPEPQGGYEHNDALRLSTPRYAMYLNTPDQGRIFLDAPRVRGQLGQTNYVLVQNEHRPTENFYFEGCFRRTHTQSIDVYHRADNSVYDHILGPGNILASTVDECIRTQESQQVVVGHHGGNFFRHGRAVYGTQYRTKTTYPNGEVTYTGWSFSSGRRRRL